MKRATTILLTALSAGAVVGLVLLFAQVSSAVPVYPPMVGGNFEFKVKANTPLDADGVALDPITRSIAIVAEDGTTPAGGCIDTPDPNGVYTFLVALSATGVRQSFKAHAYASSGCGGTISDPSVNTAYTYPGMSPRPPDLD